MLSQIIRDLVLWDHQQPQGRRAADEITDLLLRPPSNFLSIDLQDQISHKQTPRGLSSAIWGDLGDQGSLWVQSGDSQPKPFWTLR